MRNITPHTTITGMLTALLIAVCAPLMSLAQTIEDEESGLRFEVIDETTCCVTGYNEAQLNSDLVIPATVGPYSVVEIRHEALADCEKLCTVTISENVMDISDGAFRNCGSLKTLIIGAGVNMIGMDAFRFDTNLRTIISKATHAPTLMDETVFDDEVYTSATLYIPEDEQALETYFQEENNWTLFRNIVRGFDNVDTGEGFVIPEKKSITRLYTDESTNLQFGLYEDNTCTVYDYTGDESQLNVVIPPTIFVDDTEYQVVEIEESAFLGASFTSITIPEGIKTIRETAFLNCSALMSIYIPNSTTSIGSAAFLNCSALESVILGSGLKYIGSNAFCSASNIKEIISLAIKAPTLQEEYVFDPNIYETATLSIPLGDNAYSSYTDAEEGNYWHNFKQIRSIHIYEEATFYDRASGLWFTSSADGTCTIRQQIDADIHNASVSCTEIPSTVVYNDETYRVTTIADHAFFDCSELQTITIPQSITTISDYAFSGCQSLTDVTININPNGETLGNKVFESCSALTTVTFTDKSSTDDTDVTQLSENDGAASVTLGENLFEDCDNLATIVLDTKTLPVATSDTFDEDIYANTTLVYNDDLADAIAADAVWKNFLKEDIATGIDSIDTDNAAVTTDGNDIVVSRFNGTIFVYNISGMTVYQGTNNRIKANAPGIYVVVFNNRSFKVAVK
jgi:hypothetical protein